MDTRKKNLCLTLNCHIDEDINIEQLKNMYSLLVTHINEKNFIPEENNDLNFIAKKNFNSLTAQGLFMCEQIFEDIEKIENTLIDQKKQSTALKQEIAILKLENSKQNCIIQLLKENVRETHEFDQSSETQGHNLAESELIEGKSLIVEEINQLEGYIYTNIEESNLSELINILIRTILEKEEYLVYQNKQQLHDVENYNFQLLKEIEELKQWQHHQEHENEKLLNELEDYKKSNTFFSIKEQEILKLKEHFIKIQAQSDDYLKELTSCKLLMHECQDKLEEKELRYNDAVELHTIVQSNLAEQIDKYDNLHLMYNKDKKKWQNDEIKKKKLITGINSQLEEKEKLIEVLKENNFKLTQELTLSENIVENYKQKINCLEEELNDKNIKIQELQNSNIKHKQQDASFSQLTSVVKNLSIIDDRLNIFQNYLITFKNKINEYENVINGIQNLVDQKCSEENLEERHIHILSKSKEAAFKEEINCLKQKLEAKDHQITIVETIAQSQLRAATNTNISLEKYKKYQEIELRNTKAKLETLEKKCLQDTNICKYYKSDTQIECLTELVKKYRVKNQILTKLCIDRLEKIKLLKNLESQMSLQNNQRLCLKKN
ncbi:probable DNA double-strand break repair Rad50 ATPase [Daktulosphaira vitifoliae]|uniref:probable DNA double-strand break repair Rad50 ATPase n=1 Tax=Daktulosphaira vitifoliae TaxID=58002 RepID=UPI0021AA00B7|nr:probable DNA double-strand break repair Rad50 ATPase [Daktulosphaira vitifoliae]